MEAWRLFRHGRSDKPHICGTPKSPDALPEDGWSDAGLCGLGWGRWAAETSKFLCADTPDINTAPIPWAGMASWGC